MQFCAKNNMIVELSIACHIIESLCSCETLIQPSGLRLLLLILSPNFVGGSAYSVLRTVRLEVILHG